jgi:hypothetical protein
MRVRPVTAVVSMILAAGCADHASSTTPAVTGTIGPPVTVDVRTMKPVSPPGPLPTLTRTALMASDNGATVLAHVGQRITVTLQPTNAGIWDRPQVSDLRLLRLTSVTGGYPSTSPLQAAYVTIGPGQVNVATQTDLACFHGHPACAPPVTGWRVRVMVR